MYCPSCVDRSSVNVVLFCCLIPHQYKHHVPLSTSLYYYYCLDISRYNLSLSYLTPRPTPTSTSTPTLTLPTLTPPAPTLAPILIHTQVASCSRRYSQLNRCVRHTEACGSLPRGASSNPEPHPHPTPRYTPHIYRGCRVYRWKLAGNPSERSFPWYVTARRFLPLFPSYPCCNGYHGVQYGDSNGDGDWGNRTRNEH